MPRCALEFNMVLYGEGNFKTNKITKSNQIKKNNEKNKIQHLKTKKITNTKKKKQIQHLKIKK